ncbi:MAG: alpha-amylase family glycosyl hydrolase [Chitinophagaceae bacterium]
MNHQYYNKFKKRLELNKSSIQELFYELYQYSDNQENCLEGIFTLLEQAHKNRHESLLKRDDLKSKDWFLSNTITGMSLYVDRFCGNLPNLQNKLYYFEKLGVNLLHLMPLMESPENESDGGYAVSDFRKVSERFGTIEDLKNIQHKMHEKNMYLMMDIVLNHTSHKHEWAIKAKNGDEEYQKFYYCFPDKSIPNQYEAAMPEVFPESHPGNFTYDFDMQKWVMTVFHSYQWDLNFKNPKVFLAMLDNILFYANLGIDVLRIDAPAFIWKEIGTTCQNLPQAHTLLQLIKLCVNTATPGMALLGEAIVAPTEIMKYFGEGKHLAQECDFAYNATTMALLWDAIATSDTRVLLSAQNQLLEKPYGTSWISYTRCHDDIGLGYDNAHIESAGFNPFLHRKFIKEFYAGTHPYSFANGALFAVNHKTNDARISGTLASLCGLEKALNTQNELQIKTACNRILLLQAFSFFVGGLPMIFYGDEAGYMNDYSFLKDANKSYDNRWMHRPEINWDNKYERILEDSTVEQTIFNGTQQLIKLRHKEAVFADKKNLTWLSTHNIHIAGFVRYNNTKSIYCLFNFSNEVCYLTWYAFKENNQRFSSIKNLLTKEKQRIGKDDEYLIFQPYEFMIVEAII